MPRRPAPAPAPLLQGLPPIAGGDARVLVLGSMPGAESLRLQRYYAHPRNHFWPIMGELVGAGPALSYDARRDRLVAAGIAVWDVLGACRRAGSLDSAIAAQDLRANDFAAFFAARPGLRHVFFNGAYAEAAFRRHAAPAPPGLAFSRLPSTSPANASLRFEDKLRAWRALAEAIDGDTTAGP